MPHTPPGDALQLPAPAKLNLFLHITGRRTDGYHELQTLFQFLDYADQLSFIPRQDGKIQLHTPIDGVDHESNLIVRAARLKVPRQRARHARLLQGLFEPTDSDR